MTTDQPYPSSAPLSCGIAVMAKASKAGRTKTRLSAAVTFEDAARLNTAFLRDIAENLIDACAAAPIAGYMAYGPPGEAGFFHFLPPSIGLFEAWQPTFGETLKLTIRRLLDMGHSSACVLNADSPTLPPSILVECARRLAEPGDHIVLGPSTDGGYYLLGMKTLHARLFDDITWSTEHVARETRERAHELGLPVHLLPEWYDVDDASSFDILHGDLFGDRSFGVSGRRPAPARHTRGLVAELDAADMSADMGSSSRPTA